LNNIGSNELRPSMFFATPSNGDVIVSYFSSANFLSVLKIRTLDSTTPWSKTYGSTDGTSNTRGY
jgi:hypothetical protein